MLTLAYESRYASDSETRSEIDNEADAAVEAALAPLDDFIRDLATLANQVHAPGAPRAEIADCVIAQLSTWAEAGALESLATQTAQLTIGARLAGLGLVLRQAVPHTTRQEDLSLIQRWLTAQAYRQLTFWEEEAPSGARRGNLRAWAALAVAAIADLGGDRMLRAWAAWSTDYVLCTAAPDGSLPQEMTRGRLAFHYQMHAVAPLVVTSRLLTDHGFAPGARCDTALDRVVGFVIADLPDGAATREITGEEQSYFDGSREISAYNLAWLEAYLSLSPSADLEVLAALYRPLASSKLGGDQSLIWRHGAE